VNPVITGVGVAVAGAAGIADILGDRPDGPVFDPMVSLRGRHMRHKDRASKLALCAAHAALADAGLLNGGQFVGDADRTAVVVSSNLGNLDTVCRAVDTIAAETVIGLSPVDLPHTSSNCIAGWVAIHHHLRGPNVTLCNGNTSGLDAVHWADSLLRAGRADTAVVVGVEPSTEPVAKLYGGAPHLDGAAALVLTARPRGEHEVRVAAYRRAGNTVAALRDVRPTGNVLCLGASEVFGESSVDVESRLGACSGALGVLQCAVGTDRLRRDPSGSVVAVAADHDAVAALALVSGAGR
jgi:3-oxoacyl-[acyl-carrier-protein] synthase II